MRPPWALPLPLLIGLVLLGCADFPALTQDELDRHPPRPERRIASRPGAPVSPAPGDWLLFRTHGPPQSGHVMDGWERVEVVKVWGPGGRRLRLSIVGQTPYDQVECGARYDPSARNELGEYRVERPGGRPEDVSFPWMSSWNRGWHHNMPDGPRRRKAITPGLAEIDAHDDEQLLVRVAALDVGARLLGDPSSTREEIAVPAGRFEGAVAFSVTAAYFEVPWLLEALFGSHDAHHPLGPVKLWVHDQVPATGLVKMEFPSGATLELLDFGRASGSDLDR